MFPLRTLQRLSVCFLLSISLHPLAVAASSAPSHPIAFLRSLSPVEASKSLFVTIEGVLTANLPYKRSFFLQDSSGGIYVECDLQHQFRPGDRVQVKGITIPGDFLTAVTAREVVFVAKTGLPEPFRSPEPIFSGAQSANYVELDGVIRAVFHTSFGTQRLLTARLQVDDTTLPVIFTEAPAGPLPNWTGAVVRVRAVASSAVNKRRQFLGPRLVATSASNLEILTPPPADPFTLQETSIGEILNSNRRNPLSLRQVRVTGFVTLFGPQSSFILQSGSQAILVRQNGNAVFLPGSHVEVVGFLLRSLQSITLEDALVRRLPNATPPAPIRVRPSELIVPASRQNFISYESLLVQMEAKVRNSYLRNTELILELEDQAIPFEVSLPAPPTGAFATMPSAGERVRVTGVCLPDKSALGGQASFRIALRQGSDIERLDNSSFSQAVLLAVGIVLIAGVGIWMWRRSAR